MEIEWGVNWETLRVVGVLRDLAFWGGIYSPLLIHVADDIMYQGGCYCQCVTVGATSFPPATSGQD